MAHLLGIDIGTSQTTAVLLGKGGRLVASRAVKVPISFPRPGWVEQDPWAILDSVRQAVCPLVSAHAIEAVGIDNQGETFLLWDRESGQPLTPAIVWQDKRGVPVCEHLAQKVEPGWLRQKTGLLLDSYFSGPKLRFILDQDEALLAAAASGRLCFGTTETWVLWNLSKRRLHITDPSTASRTLLFDINRLDWDDELLTLFTATRSMLPEICPSAGYLGEVDLGGSNSFPLFASLADQQAALFGQACLAPGDIKCTFGTGAFLLMNIGLAPRLSSHGLLTTVAWHMDGVTTYALDGGVFAVGAAVQWLAETLRLLPDAAASAQAAEQSADSGPVFVPALAGLAAPFWQPKARGAIFGLSRASAPADIARATLEGIACLINEVVKAMERDAGHPLTTLKVDGGPSGNRYLMQFLADILAAEVHVAAAREATAMGAAELAGHVALGTSLEELASRWQAETVYYPHMAARERETRLERWQRALAAVQHFHEGQD